MHSIHISQELSYLQHLIVISSRSIVLCPNLLAMRLSDMLLCFIDDICNLFVLALADEGLYITNCYQYHKSWFRTTTFVGIN